MRYAKPNKYNARSSVYNGRRYDSKLEASYAMQLDWMKKAGQVKKWIPQYKIDLRINDVHIANYYIDFKVIYTSGHVEYWEVKGFVTNVWKLKYAMAKAIYPDWNFVVKK
jgi:hypothetical protein